MEASLGAGVLIATDGRKCPHSLMCAKKGHAKGYLHSLSECFTAGLDNQVSRELGGAAFRPALSLVEPGVTHTDTGP